MNIKKGILVFCAVMFLLLIIFSHPLLAQEDTEETPQESTEATTSTEETTVPKHWSKYVYPEVIEAGKAVHIIKDGDTLWDLAVRYLKDGYLWPKIWEANKYIKNSHWIYPGDPLVIPGVTSISDADIAQSELDAKSAEDDETTLYDFSEDDLAGMEGEEDFEFDDDDFIDDIASIKPIAKYYDINCYDTVLPDENMFDARVISAEKVVKNLKTFDYVYIDLGSDQNIQVGDIFSVMHRDEYRPVHHPLDNDFIGWPYLNVGKIKVVMVFGDFSIARVTETCLSINVGDQIRPFKKLPVPLLEDDEEVSYYQEASAKPSGFIVYMQNDRKVIGKGFLGVVELGKDDGIELGDILTVYRENEVVGLPRVILGKAVVLVVEEETAVFKVLQNRFEIFVGDMVEIQ